MYHTLQKIQRRLASEMSMRPFAKEVQQWPWDHWFPPQKQHKIQSHREKRGAFQVVEGDQIDEYALENAPKPIQQAVLGCFEKEKGQQRIDLLFQSKARSHRIIAIPDKSSLSLSFHNLVFSDDVYYVIVGVGARVDIYETYQEGEIVGPEQLGGTSVFLVVQDRACVNYVISSDVRYSYQAFYSISLGKKSQCSVYPLQRMHGFQHVTFAIDQHADQSQMQMRGILETDGTSRSVLRLTAGQKGKLTDVDLRYRIVARDTSFTHVNGNIQVGIHASLSKSFLEAKALLLSKEALVRVLPHLEILNNDVACAHSASVGYLPSEALYYLMSRGITEEDARALLVQAFLKEIFLSVENRHVQHKFVQYVSTFSKK